MEQIPFLSAAVWSYSRLPFWEEGRVPWAGEKSTSGGADFFTALASPRIWSLERGSSCVFVCVFTCLFTCVFVLAHVFAYMCACMNVLYICLHVCVLCECVFACIYEKLYLCVCVYIYIYMYLHIHTYIIPQEQEETSIPTQEDREFAFP